MDLCNVGISSIDELPCSIKNCSHLCITQNMTAQCLCELGFTLGSNGTSCDGKSHLFFFFPSSIRIRSYLYLMLSDILCLAVRPTNHYIIYTNAKLGRVRGVDVTSGSDVMAPIVNAWRPVAVDYDLAPAGSNGSDVIYYSDTARGVINKREVEGNVTTTVLSGKPEA